MSQENKNPLVGFTTNFLKRPFLLRGHRKKPSSRSVHTLHARPCVIPSNLRSKCHKPSGDSPIRETNVNKIMRMIPGLGRAKKVVPDEPKIGCVKATVMHVESSENGKLIHISPSKGKKMDKPESCKKASPSISRSSSNHECATKPKKNISNPRMKPKKSKKESRPSLKVAERSRRLNISKICLNVNVSGPMYVLLENLKKHEIKNIVTLSGAGISTAAGIPDFRSPDTGLYDKLAKYNLPYAQAVFERKYFDKNPKPFFSLLKESLGKEYRPTVAHYFIKLLEERGLLLRHFTQNVDGLERLAGVPYDRIVEAHGTVYTSRCMKCRTEYDLQWLRDQLIYQGKSIPCCQASGCSGIVKPNVVLFGDPLSSQFCTRLNKDLPRSDLLIIMGTSLVVEPFASAVKKVSSSTLRVIINNMQVGEHLGIVYEGSKDFNRKKKKGTWRDIFIQGSCDDGVLHLAKLFRWERDLQDLVKRCEPRVSPSESPLQPVVLTSTHRTSAREEETLRKTMKTDTACSQKDNVSSEPGKSIDKQPSPVSQVLVAATATVPTTATVSPQQTVPSEDETSKNWWKSLSTRVRNLTHLSQR